MGIYDRAKKTAIRLIRKYGQEVQWLASQPIQLDDDAEPWLPSQTNFVPFNVRMVFTQDKLDSKEELRYMKDSEIVDGQVNALMEPVKGFVPRLKDKIVRDGQTLTVDNINPVNPGGTILLYKLELGT